MDKTSLTIVVGTVIAVSGLSAFASVESSVASAMRACEAFDRMGVVSENCEVSAPDFSIELSMDISGRSAIDICREAAENMKKAGIFFDQQWRLKISSSVGNGKISATCPLSQ